MAQKWAKIMASLALLWIIISILWTWIQVLISSKKTPELTPEKIAEIQEMIKSQSWTTSTWELNWTWNTIEIN